jgi:hypothetical protein
MEKEYPHTAHPISRHARRHSKLSDYDDCPTTAETTLPWRRDLSQVVSNNRFSKIVFFIFQTFLTTTKGRERDPNTQITPFILMYKNATLTLSLCQNAFKGKSLPFYMNECLGW